MTPAEELREAARQLRAKAQMASPEWRVDVVGPLGAATVLRSADVATNLVRDAVYVAAMHPLVGLALADVFAAIASSIERAQHTGVPQADRGPVADAAALLARAFLGAGGGPRG